MLCILYDKCLQNSNLVSLGQIYARIWCWINLQFCWIVFVYTYLFMSEKLIELKFKKVWFLEAKINIYF